MNTEDRAIHIRYCGGCAKLQAELEDYKNDLLHASDETEDLCLQIKAQAKKILEMKGIK